MVMLWPRLLTTTILLAIEAHLSLGAGTLLFRLANLPAEPHDEGSAASRERRATQPATENFTIRFCLRRPADEEPAANCSATHSDLGSESRQSFALPSAQTKRIKFSGSAEGLTLRLELHVLPRLSVYTVLLSHSKGRWSSWTTFQTGGRSHMANIALQIRWKVSCNQSTMCPTGLCAYDCNQLPRDNDQPSMLETGDRRDHFPEQPAINFDSGIQLPSPEIGFGQLKECNSSTRGAMWYGSSDKALRVCDGKHWRCAEPGSCEAYSLSEGQHLPPSHRAHQEQAQPMFGTVRDFQTFEENRSRFMVACHGLSHFTNSTPLSYVFKRLPSGRFKRVQLLKNLGDVRGCRVFTQNGKRYLSVVSDRSLDTNNVKKAEILTLVWSPQRQKFKRRAIVTEMTHHSVRGCDTFEANGVTHLVTIGTSSTNQRQGTWISIHYWTPAEKFQVIYNVDHTQQRSGVVRIPYTATAVECISVSGHHFLALSLFLDSRSGNTVLNSPVFLLNLTQTKRRGRIVKRSARLITLQQLPTAGAAHFEHFMIDSDLYLVVANSLRQEGNRIRNNHQNPFGETRLASNIYKFDYKEQQFMPFQSITLTEASFWHHFSICGDHYLAAASYNKRSVNSGKMPATIFRWRGIEKFVEWHEVGPENSKTHRWQYMQFGQSHYLAQTYATTRYVKTRLLDINVKFCGCQPRF